MSSLPTQGAGLPSQSGQITAFDGLRIVHRLWAADAPKAGLLVVHGFAEHGLRYGHLLDALVPAGVSVMTWDQRGHGSSGGRRGHIERFADYTDDVEMMIAFARQRLPSPLFVLGHSMGGLIMTRIAVERGLDVAGLVLSNPFLALKLPVPAWKELAAKGLSSLMPTLPIPSDLPPTLISRDPEEVRKYAEDPLVFNSATARWGAEIFRIHDAVAARFDRFAFGPTLVQVGTGDGIADPAVTTRLFGSVRREDCRVEVYPDAFHELYNEPDEVRTAVLADLSGWILEHAAAAG